MANFNIAILIGNLTKDPELRYTPSGAAVVNITLAVNRTYKVGEETKKEVAFIPVVIWNKIAEVVNQYCNKGSSLMVKGRIQTRSWEKDGVKQYKTEVVAENIQLMGKKEDKPAEDKSEEPSDAAWLDEQEG